MPKTQMNCDFLSCHVKEWSYLKVDFWLAEKQSTGIIRHKTTKRKRNDEFF